MKKTVCLLCTVFLLFGMMPGGSAEADSVAVRWFGTTISAGEFHMSAIKNDGSLWAWGTNAYGALGTGIQEDTNVPIRILDDVSSTIGGDSGAYGAIKSDGELWNWGLHGNYGRLGREAEGWLLKPGKLMDCVLMADMGAGHSAALTEDGTLWMWGQNNHGELGNGRKGTQFIGEWTETVYEPLPFKVMTDIEYVEAGEHCTFAIDKDHRLWAWGDNGFHQLGIGEKGDMEVPIWKAMPDDKTLIQSKPVPVMEDVAAVSAENATTILKTDGSLWVCGEGIYSLDDENQMHYEPYKIMKDVVSAVTSHGHFAAIRKDGSLWTWSIYPQPDSALGAGEDLPYYEEGVPVKIMDDVTSVTAGSDFMAALKKDGTLWTWGKNDYGQLGNGTNEESWVPVKIMDDVALPTPQEDEYRISIDNASSQKKQTDKTGKGKGSKGASKQGSCTIRFDANGGTCKTKSKKGVFAQPYGTLPTPTLKGKSFSGWYTKPTEGDKITAYSVVIDKKDHTLYAHWDDSNGKPTAVDLSYQFCNSRADFHYPNHYRIPYERYAHLFGDGTTAEVYYSIMGEWGGSCYGMCASAAMLFCKNGTDPEDFRKGARKPDQLKLQDYSKELGMKLIEFVESAHILQITHTVGRIVKKNRNAYYTIVKAVQDFAKNGKDPVIISIKGPKEPDGSVPGHAVIGYAVGRVKNKKMDAIRIYDPNYPSDTGRYIELTWDKPGHYTGWHYRMNDREDWGTRFGGDISFSQYSDVYSVWKDIAEESPDGSTLRMNTDNAMIYDYSGNLVAEIKDGIVITDRTDVYKMEVINESAEDAAKGFRMTLSLPTDYYIVRNTDPDTQQLELSLYNGEQDVAVSTTSGTVLCYANAEDEASMVYVGEQNQSYEVIFTSGKDGEGNRTVLSGVTAEEVPTSIGQLSGTLYTTGVSLGEENRLEIDGAQGTEDNLVSSSMIYMVSSSVPEAEETIFTDVPGDSEYMPAIQWAWQNEIIEETALGTFSPDDTCTAADALDAVWRALGMPLANDGDTEGNGAEAARWAEESGFAFSATGEKECSAADILLLLWQAEGEPGREEEIAEKENAVLWANDLQVITDEMVSGDGLYTAPCTRAELARILYTVLSM